MFKGPASSLGRTAGLKKGLKLHRGALFKGAVTLFAVKEKLHKTEKKKLTGVLLLK